MGYLGKKVKAASKAAKEGNTAVGWTALKSARGGRRCKGCGEDWDRMSKARIIAHAECEDSDGCPDTSD